MKQPTVSNVDEYIESFDGEIRVRLEKMRHVIRTAAPDAEEGIGYGMPAYKLNGPLVYFAAFANHVGFYATPQGHEAFVEELAGYKQGKGSVQFPHERPLPLLLIERIVRFKVANNAEKKKKK